ncbi:MAG: AbrB/MazE/SpoVT family DNA-binding domain-containing protein [Deltaproteobacteria bacterium]|nr:AbrB/MazE/SpoVT family DNA-binding domain-containing protein [Deltaproteobacteria bacterium]
MRAWVSEKGQVTIPKPIRDKLGIRPGCVMDFDAKNGVLIGRKSEPAEDPVSAVTGIIGSPADIDAYLDASRGRAE